VTCSLSTVALVRSDVCSRFTSPLHFTPLIMSAVPPTISLDASAASKAIDAAWDASVLQTLKDYISIPNQVSERNGHGVDYD
jgi:hypothetical protein